MGRPLRYIPDGGSLVEVTVRTIQTTSSSCHASQKPGWHLWWGPQSLGGVSSVSGAP